MPVYTIPIPQTLTPQSANTYTRYLKLPPIVDCPNPLIPPFIGSIADGYNCNRCGPEPPFYMAYRRGDIIPLQLSVPDNMNPTNAIPIIGWRNITDGDPNWFISAELFESDCVTSVSQFVDDFCSDWWVAYSPTLGGVQTLFVDTNTFPVGMDGFRIKFQYKDRSGAVMAELWTEPFREVGPCDQSIVIEAQYSETDCQPRDYRSLSSFVHIASGNPPNYTPTPYVTRFRWVAEVVFDGQVTERETNEETGIVLNQRIIKRFSINLLTPIPPYAAHILGHTVAANVRVLVDGEEYVNFSDVLREGNEVGRTFTPLTINCEQICAIERVKNDC